MASQQPFPEVVDTTTPNVARMYDYYLGGKNNFAADRRAADRILAMVPGLRETARLNREFLARAVGQLVGKGVRQFIDIGSGLPTQGNVHEVAQKADPAARVAYVDYDPVVCAHGRVLLEQSDGVAVVQADLRRPGEILNSTEVRSLIDFEQPVAVLLVAILHFVPDDEDPPGIIAQFRDAVTSGSHLVISHASADAVPGREHATATVSEIYRRANASLVLRHRGEVERLFDGFDLVDPGVVWLAECSGTVGVEAPEDSLGYAGVGRKP